MSVTEFVQHKKHIHLISFVFFLSGASALIFETVWFHVLSTVLGSSIWSAAAVLTAFMAGIAIGNFLAAVYASRLAGLTQLYIAIEFVIGISGALIVALLPVLSPYVAQLLSSSVENYSVLQFLRFACAFLVLLIPTAAMGMTLPVMQKILLEYDPGFLQSLSKLYGWNTIGAVVGTLCAEFFLVHYLGIKSAALTACLLNFLAAYLILKNFPSQAIRLQAMHASEWLQRFIALGPQLLAPFITGFLLLALEVVWFRYLLLLHIGSSTVFAIMLATVLIGIGLGGLLIGRVKISEDLRKSLLLYLPVVLAVLVVTSFAVYDRMFMGFINAGNTLTFFPVFAVALMFPVCFVSGVIFPLYGENLYRNSTEASQSSGLLIFANTLGAAIGSAIATFVLLPAYGVELSILVLALLYLLAIVPVSSALRHIDLSQKLVLPAVAVLIILVVFPFGAVEKAYTHFGKEKLPGDRLVFVNEGLTETVQYYEAEKFGQPVAHRLVTNSFSMSGTNFAAVRYMQMFVYLPYIFNQDIKNVLQISYGVGNTAEAVIALDSVEHYDIVDPSKSILKNSKIIHDFSGRYPLQDPRTHVHVEDGRFFLQTTDREYDLITGEPPPPQQAGIVNLYTQEYFQLILDKLSPDGIASYWLPVHAMHDSDALAITKAFCQVFKDCSLWSGAGMDFILLGSRNGIKKPTVENFSRPWNSELKAELFSIAVERPYQLAPMFLADNQLLNKLTENTNPVTDNYPHRISPSITGLNDFFGLFAYFLDIERRKDHYLSSEYIKSILPQDIYQKSLKYFDYEDLISASAIKPQYINTDIYYWEELSNVLTKTDFEVLPLLMLKLNPKEKNIFKNLDTDESPEVLVAHGKILLAERQYQQAAQVLDQYIRHGDIQGDKTSEIKFHLLARALAGRPKNFGFDESDQVPEHLIQFQRWYQGRFLDTDKT